MSNSNPEQYGYTQIYGEIYSALKTDSVDEKIAVVTAKRLTDAIWNLHLVLNTGKNSLENTVNKVKDIVQDRIKGGGRC